MSLLDHDVSSWRGGASHQHDGIRRSNPSRVQPSSGLREFVAARGPEGCRRDGRTVCRPGWKPPCGARNG